jgi:VanZ family protein
MKKIIRFIPALLWMGFIFYLSSQQTTGIGGDSYWQRFFILKTFHLIEYAVLFILINFAINSKLYSLTLSYLYGISDEFHQSFIPGRTAKFIDTFIDLLGIFIGLLILKFIILPFIKKLKLSKGK